MSIESWMEEFYPITAEDIADRPDATDEELILHSLNKWKGALPENTEKHGVVYKDHLIDDLFDGPDIGITFAVGSCSLCQRYDGNSCGASYRTESKECPIVRMRGLPCDRGSDDDQNAYSGSDNNPKPMIRLLEETLVFVRYGG